MVLLLLPALMGWGGFRGFVGGVSSSDPVHFGVRGRDGVGLFGLSWADGLDGFALFVVRDALVLGGLPQRTRARAPGSEEPTTSEVLAGCEASEKTREPGTPALFDCLILYRPGSQGTRRLFCLMGWRPFAGPSAASGFDGSALVSRFFWARIF